MGKKKEKKQKRAKAAEGYVPVCSPPVPEQPEAAELAVDPDPAPLAGRAAIAQRIALAAFEAADAAQVRALETGMGVERSTGVLETALAALALADAAAEAETSSAPDAGEQVEAALEAAAAALRDAQPSEPESELEQEPEAISSPVLEHEMASREEMVRDGLPPLFVADSITDEPSEALRPVPALCPSSHVCDLPKIEMVADPSSSVSTEIIAVPMPAPGTLPLSKREKRQRARADARAAKERAAAERANEAQARRERRAGDERGKATAKAASEQAKKNCKEAKRQAEGSVKAAAAETAPADQSPTATATVPASAAPDYEKQPRAARNACIVLALLLLATAGLVVAAWLGFFRLPAAVQDRIDLLPDPNATVGKLNAADSPVAPGSYRLVVNQIPTSQGPANVVNIEFENPVQNSYSARMDIYLDDTGELVGSTRMVPPGAYLEDLTLVGDLPPGTYEATAKVGVYSGATRVNTMSAALELRIEG